MRCTVDVFFFSEFLCVCADNDNSNNKRFSCTGLYIFKFSFFVLFFFCFHSFAGAAIVKKKMYLILKKLLKLEMLSNDGIRVNHSRLLG